MQRLRLQGEVLGRVPVQARQEDELNSLDPTAKRLRVADRSLQQARNAVLGAQLALDALPRTGLSPLNDALASMAAALRNLDEAAAAIDQTRLEPEELA
jgi:hypothetical protein